jgi:hypothetical protein
MLCRSRTYTARRELLAGRSTSCTWWSWFCCPCRHGVPRFGPHPAGTLPTGEAADAGPVYRGTAYHNRRPVDAGPLRPRARRSCCCCRGAIDYKLDHAQPPLRVYSQRARTSSVIRSASTNANHLVPAVGAAALAVVHARMSNTVITKCRRADRQDAVPPLTGCGEVLGSRGKGFEAAWYRSAWPH